MSGSPGRRVEVRKRVKATRLVAEKSGGDGGTITAEERITGGELVLEGTARIGETTGSGAPGSLTLGRFNVARAWTETVFAVGTGPNASTPQDAITVFSDGRIQIKPQGDILMGEFGE